jgi:hypothetical protein
VNDKPVGDDPTGTVSVEGREVASNDSTAATRYGPTGAARRRAWLLVAVTVVVVFALVSAASYIIAGQLLGVVWWIVGAASAASVLGTRQVGSISLLISPSQVVYATRAFTLASSWAGVEALVRLSPKQTSLALRLASPAVTKELRAPLGAAWRSQPYPYDRTIPLQLFLGGPQGERLMAQLRLVAPGLFEAQPTLDPREPVEPRWRLVGLVAGLVPAVVLAVVSALLLFPPPFTRLSVTYLGLETVALVALAVTRLRRWRPGTGERTVDFVGRVLVAPRAVERRNQVVRPLLTLIVAMVAVLGFGYGVGRLYVAASPGPCQPYRPFAAAPTPSGWPGDAPADIAITLGPDWVPVPLTEAGLASFEQANNFTNPTALTASVEGSIAGGMVQMGLRNLTGATAVVRLLDLSCPAVASVVDLDRHLDALVAGEAVVPGTTVRDRVPLGPRTIERVAYQITNSDGSISYHDLHAWQVAGHVYELFVVAETPDTYRTEIEAGLSQLG